MRTFNAWRQGKRCIYPQLWMFPADWLLNQRFDAIAKVPMLKVPVLFIHGTADTEVPYIMSERLFNAATGSKWPTLVPGGGYEDSARVGETLYARAVLGFVQTIRAGRW